MTRRGKILNLFREGRSINFYGWMADFVRQNRVKFNILQWVTMDHDSFFFPFLSPFNEWNVDEFFCNDFLLFKFGEYTRVIIRRKKFFFFLSSFSIFKCNFEVVWDRIKFLITNLMIYQSLTKEIPRERITEILGIDFLERDFFVDKGLAP